MVTLVSFYPREFDEFVPFLYPSRYYIEASDGTNPKFLTIKNGYYVISEDLKIDVPAEKVAHSLVNDFRMSSMFVTETAYPAVFYVPDTVDASSLKKYQNLVKESLDAQKRWFERLVQIADDNWQRYKLHRTISDVQRMAAKFLNLDREWADVFDTCPACQTKVKTAQVICHNCRYILNETAYKNMKFATV